MPVVKAPVQLDAHAEQHEDREDHPEADRAHQSVFAVLIAFISALLVHRCQDSVKRLSKKREEPPLELLPERRQMLLLKASTALKCDTIADQGQGKEDQYGGIHQQDQLVVLPCLQLIARKGRFQLLQVLLTARLEKVAANSDGL